MTTSGCYTIVVPVYRNRSFVPALVERMESLQRTLPVALEVIFVIDGCPERTEIPLAEKLGQSGLTWKILHLSRNFGSFQAIRAGLEVAQGELIAVMAADLQEPEELYRDFWESYSNSQADVLLARRRTRQDPLLSQFSSNLFWWLMRTMVIKEIPPGGVDVFAVSRHPRDLLLRMEDANTSLIGQLYWVGFKRAEISYDRVARSEGKSGWSFRRRLKYLMDSIFSFTSKPLELLMWVGGLGIVISSGLAAVIFALRMLGQIEVPGYSAIMLMLAFVQSLNLLCFGVMGMYLWRTFENTKARPGFIVWKTEEASRRQTGE